MKNIEKIKIIFGCILIGYAIIGIFTGLSYQFGWDLFKKGRAIFGWSANGGVSNAPIFYGLTAIAGSILLATVKDKD